MPGRVCGQQKKEPAAVEGRDSSSKGRRREGNQGGGSEKRIVTAGSRCLKTAKFSIVCTTGPQSQAEYASRLQRVGARNPGYLRSRSIGPNSHGTFAAHHHPAHPSAQVRHHVPFAHVRNCHFISINTLSYFPSSRNPHISISESMVAPVVETSFILPCAARPQSSHIRPGIRGYAGSPG